MSRVYKSFYNTEQSKLILELLGSHFGVVHIGDLLQDLSQTHSVLDEKLCKHEISLVGHKLQAD